MGVRVCITGPLDFEQWRDIQGYPGYKVSSLGRVVTFLKRAKTHGASYYISDEPTLLKLHPDTAGHLKASLRCRTVPVHVLVLEAFIGPKPQGLECRHLDDNKTHNHLQNLEWGTRQQNMQDRISNGIIKPRLTNADLDAIQTQLTKRRPQSKIAEDFGVSQSTISKINLGLRKAYVNHPFITR